MDIKFNESCSTKGGKCCFESTPCQYCGPKSPGCPSCDKASLEQQKVEEDVTGDPPKNASECKKVKNINTGLDIKFNESCSTKGGKCCFESTPCQYCGPKSPGCPSCDKASLEQQKVE